jgi:hypothetical protein
MQKPISPERAHHDFVRHAILKVFLVSRRTSELAFIELFLQLDADGCPMLAESLADYLDDMKDRGWVAFTTRRTEKALREIIRVRILPKGRDVFDGVLIEPGIPSRHATNE